MAALPPFELILSRLPSLREQVADDRHTLLAELAMLSEIPAPTFGEQHRADSIEPMATGLTQLIGIRLAIDEGDCVD